MNYKEYTKRVAVLNVEWTVWDNDRFYNIVKYSLPYYSEIQKILDRKEIGIKNSYNDIVCHPAVSFDKKLIVFGVEHLDYRNKICQNSLFVANIDGSDLEKIAEFSNKIDSFSLWYKIYGFNKDNTKIFYSLSKGSDSSYVRIYSFDLIKRENKELCDIRGGGGGISPGSMNFFPDGQRIVFHSYDGFITILNLNDCSQEKITDGINPVCSPNGKYVAYQKRNKKKEKGDFYIIKIENFKEYLLLSQEKYRPRFSLKRGGYWVDSIISWSADSRYILFHRSLDPMRKDKKTPTVLLLDLRTKEISEIPRNKVKAERLEDETLDNPSLTEIFGF